MKKTIFSVILTVITILFFTFSTFAITPPEGDPTGETIYKGSVNLTQTDAQAVYSYLFYLDQLNYFQSGDMMMVGRSSSTTRMLIARDEATITIDSTAGTITTTGNVLIYEFTKGGYKYYGTGGTTTWNLQNVICYKATVDGAVMSNLSNYAYGTATSTEFQATVAQWKDFYEKVYYYNENIADAEAQGRADGYEDGYSAGYDIGEIDGYEDGYSDGNAEGYETGYTDGYADAEADYENEYQNGFEDGKTEGVAEGYETGYNVGYGAGQENGYSLGLTDGRLEGYENGYNDGYDDGIAEGGGSGSESIPFELTFYLEVPINVDDSGLITYRDYLLTWKNEDPETLGFRDPEDEDEGPLAGFYAYHTIAYFSPDQVKNPSSVSFTIPSEILTIVPTAEFGSIVFDTYEVIEGTRVARVYLIYDQYVLGYNNGFQDANAIVESLGEIAKAPVEAMKDALDFDIFGINVGVVLIGIIALIFVFIAWRLIKKVIPV